jgi:hypothetical protein
MLHVFTRNVRARRIYRAAGFILTDQSDGTRNEEREPDCTYTWPANRTSAETSLTEARPAGLREARVCQWAADPLLFPGASFVRAVRIGPGARRGWPGSRV